MISIASAIYYAAFVDAEGSVCISRTSNKQGKQYHYLSVSASNTHKGVLLEAQRLFGGTVYLLTGQCRAERKPCWAWSITSKAAAQCLAVIAPHMVIKKRQAVLALAFVALFNAKTYNRLSIAEIAHRQCISDEMKQLNATYHLETPEQSVGEYYHA